MDRIFRTCFGGPPISSTRFCVGQSQLTSRSSNRPSSISSSISAPRKRSASRSRPCSSPAPNDRLWHWAAHLECPHSRRVLEGKRTADHAIKAWYRLFPLPLGMTSHGRSHGNRYRPTRALEWVHEKILFICTRATHDEHRKCFGSDLSDADDHHYSDHGPLQHPANVGRQSSCSREICPGTHCLCEDQSGKDKLSITWLWDTAPSVRRDVQVDGRYRHYSHPLQGPGRGGHGFAGRASPNVFRKHRSFASTY